ncbi:hypothetical protein E2C01_017983 [Portunus trituberculatus]|uniref:Uncharacterized protein n=1 Tax=Portunus trituberculatus TaxID=210409 RepID=A0A5B7DV06_PORTR|nr:hypothetical protein [Portunus trituberculatus]
MLASPVVMKCSVMTKRSPGSSAFLQFVSCVLIRATRYIAKWWSYARCYLSNINVPISQLSCYCLMAVISVVSREIRRLSCKKCKSCSIVRRSPLIVLCETWAYEHLIIPPLDWTPQSEG